ncbi:hypothetical protein ACJIZ3_000925 [Penstemon smallii]|uniref:Exonuclease domain-containing protein n=1 Tax=Penstemon smallii TaxID=265156 RepID=A0ABD3U384_9LAMI
MCFSLLQFPRCKIHTLSNYWWGNIYKLGSTSVGSSKHIVLCSNKDELEGGYSRKWTRRTINTKTGESSNDKLTSKSNTLKLESTEIEKSRTTSIRNKIIRESTSSKSKIETTDVESDQFFIDLAKHATVICFDIETTGLSKDKDRILEIALQDLRGGENSTFETLVNPQRNVLNERIHGISSLMVNKSDVPRMKDLIPILIQYVRSRQIPNGIVVLVSHNGSKFDVPFLKSEFKNCSYEIPKDWFFADTIPLARRVMKSRVMMSNGSKTPIKISLQALREHYGIPLIGSAHRALSDVHTLSLILQRLTYDLKLPVSGLIKEFFNHEMNSSSFFRS